MRLKIVPFHGASILQLFCVHFCPEQIMPSAVTNGLEECDDELDYPINKVHFESQRVPNRFRVSKVRNEIARATSIRKRAFKILCI